MISNNDCIIVLCWHGEKALSKPFFHSIPKYCNCTVGLTVLCGAIGTRSILNAKVNQAIVLSAVALGGYIVRKLSNKYKINSIVC